jgi:acetyl-CoA acetyltransferase
MTQSLAAPMPAADPDLSCRAAIVGVGETDYGRDYAAHRAKAPGYVVPTVETLSVTAFERALADAGLSRGDVDGLAVSYTYGGPSPDEMAALLGFDPRYRVENGNIMTGPLPVICAEIAAGKAETVAMVFAVASRTSGRQFGGAVHSAASEATPSSYYYHLPWGWSSQAAHWAFVAAAYQAQFGTREEDLGSVAVQLRRNAMATDNATMRDPITIADYMASRYIVRPLHLLDMCLVNDGAVCLIVRRPDLARNMAKPPVLVAGWGHSRMRHRKLDLLVRQRLRPQIEQARGQALAMAGVALGDVRHFECYDPASQHIITQVEGYGFFAEGTGMAAFGEGAAAPDGALPVNTAGGMMSGSYMQGWSHVVECVRQLRGEATGRQVPNAAVSMSSLCETDSAFPIVYVREG